MQGSECCQPFRYSRRAEVPCMPDLVAGFEVPEYIFIQGMMRIG
jgi:hypothetical protein